MRQKRTTSEFNKSPTSRYKLGYDHFDETNQWNDGVDPIDWKSKEFDKHKYEVAKVFNCPVWIDLGQNSIATIVSKTLANGLDSGMPLELSINMSMNCFIGPIILFGISIFLFILLVSVFCIYSKKKNLNFKSERKGLIESLKFPKKNQSSVSSTSQNANRHERNENERNVHPCHRGRGLFGELNTQATNVSENHQNVNLGYDLMDHQHQSHHSHQSHHTHHTTPTTQGKVQPFIQTQNPNLPTNFLPNLADIKEEPLRASNMPVRPISELRIQTNNHHSHNHMNTNTNTRENISKTVTFPNKNLLITSLSNQFASKVSLSNQKSIDEGKVGDTRPYHINGNHIDRNNNDNILNKSAFQQKNDKIKDKSVMQIRPTTVIISSNKRADRIKTTPQYVKKERIGQNQEIIFPKEKPEITRSTSPSKLNCLDGLSSHNNNDHVANTITI